MEYLTNIWHILAIRFQKQSLECIVWQKSTSKIYLQVQEIIIQHSYSELSCCSLEVFWRNEKERMEGTRFITSGLLCEPCWPPLWAFLASLPCWLLLLIAVHPGSMHCMLLSVPCMVVVLQSLLPCMAHCIACFYKFYWLYYILSFVSKPLYGW